MLHCSSNARRALAAVTFLLVASLLPTRALAQARPAPEEKHGPESAEPPSWQQATEAAASPAPSTSAGPAAAPTDRPASEPRVIYVKSPPGASSSVPAEEEPPPGGSLKWLLSLSLVHSSLSGGDFNDANALVRGTASGAEAVLLPELGSGTGFAFDVAYGWEDPRVGGVGFSTGFGYAATWHVPHSTQTSGLGTALLHELELPARVSVQLSRYIRPYLYASLALAYMSLSGAHVVASGADAQFDSQSTTFSGISLGVGLGLVVRVADGVGVDALFGYRSLTFNSVDGASTPSGLSTDGWTVRLGPTFVL